MSRGHGGPAGRLGLFDTDARFTFELGTASRPRPFRNFVLETTFALAPTVPRVTSVPLRRYGSPLLLEAGMPLYLWQASYTAEGTKGLLKDGGSKRRDVVKQMTEQLGGRMHAFYYAFGDADVVGISEFPDHATALALSLAVNASGAAELRSTLLLTPEEVDAATKKPVSYRPPGA